MRTTVANRYNNRHTLWTWKDKGYPDPTHTVIMKGKGPKTKKGNKKDRAQIKKMSAHNCPFEEWRRSRYTDYMAVELALGNTPMDSIQWYEKFKKKGHRLISTLIKLYWETYA